MTDPFETAVNPRERFPKRCTACFCGPERKESVSSSGGESCTTRRAANFSILSVYKGKIEVFYSVGNRRSTPLASRLRPQRSRGRSRAGCPFHERTTPAQAFSLEISAEIQDGVSRCPVCDESGCFLVKFSSVYLLVRESDPARHYVGLTDDLKDRLRRHNAGEVTHTAKYGPWKIPVAVAFNDRKKASEFEIYLKTHSGRAFAQRHF